MRYLKKPSEKLMDVVLYILLSFLTLITLYPIWHVVMASISDGNELMRHSGPVLLPKGFSLSAYSVVFKNSSILTGYANTIFYVVVSTALNLTLTILGAYVLSRKGFMWGPPIMVLITITMFFSGGMIPTYLLVEGLGMVDTRLALILPTAINTYNLIIM
ncbi:MAG: carbohydrate ABC transporter permease, partial [Clostridia bacterium]